jgi:hypothetical protein
MNAQVLCQRDTHVLQPEPDSLMHSGGTTFCDEFMSGCAMRLVTILVAFSAIFGAHAFQRRLGAPHRGSIVNVSSDLLSRCELKWFRTNLDHFSRVRVCNFMFAHPRFSCLNTARVALACLKVWVSACSC